MNMPATPALAHFEARKDDPKVQGLTHFIQLTLNKPLSHVNVWNIAPYVPGVEDVRPFTLELSDGSQIAGNLRQHAVQGRLGAPVWHIRGVTEEEKWSVDDDWRYTF